MPMLDVSDVLADPMFADSFTIRRTAVTVADNGRGQPVLTDIAATGVVQSGSGDTLRLGPDAAMVAGNIEVHTTTPLRSATATSAADIIVWQGREYTVRVVNDYARLGGYYAAICDAKPLVAA